MLGNFCIAKETMPNLHAIVATHKQRVDHEGIILGDQINKPGLRFLPELSLSGLAEVVYFYLLL